VLFDMPVPVFINFNETFRKLIQEANRNCKSSTLIIFCNMLMLIHLIRQYANVNSFN